MPSRTSTKQQTHAVRPIQTMRGHTNNVRGVVHLPGGRRIITCSWDGSLRLWDLESGAQIGGDWRDEQEKESGVHNIALSPKGKTVVSGSNDGKVRLWDVETGKVILKWTGHSESVSSVCWSAGGDRLVSGSYDGTARVWNVKTGETILEIKTGHQIVWVVLYSPDNTRIATGGRGETAVNIWDAKTGKLITTLKHDPIASSLAWTSDGKKLISAAYYDLIRIFDAVTWQQIATLEDHNHTRFVNTITLSRNNRLLASASSYDNTVWLWNLATNLPVGPPLQHKGRVYSAAFSANGRVLVTGCNTNTYAWGIHAILKQAGLEDLLSTDTNIASQGEPAIERTPRSSLSDKSFLEADATRCHDEFGDVDVLSPRFFVGMEADCDSSPTGDARPHSSASAFFARLASLLHRFRPDTAEVNELSQPPTLSGLHPRALFARLSSLIHRSPPQNDAPNELQQLSTPPRLHLHAFLARLSSLLPRSQLNTEYIEPHTVTPSRSRPNALMNLLSSPFRSQHHTNEDIELSQYATRLHVVEVAPMRDREVLYVAERRQADRPHHQSTGTPHSRPIRLLGHIGLLLCCVCNHQHTDGSTQPTPQQQGQSQDQVLAQASSLQTTPAALSTSTAPTVSNIHMAAPAVATA